MEHSIADEIYSESLKTSEKKSDHVSTADVGNTDVLKYDDSLWGDSDDNVDEASDLDREWQRRHDQFHTMGYRDGLLAGKEASVQEGFNLGFKDSAAHGYKWGLVRGVTSALACLPDDLKEKLIDTQEKRIKFSYLGESVRSISTTDALKLFHDEIIKSKSVDQNDTAMAIVHITDSQKQNRCHSDLENFFGELQSLLHESPAVGVHLSIDQ